MSKNVKAHLEHGEFIEHNVRAPLGIKSGGNLDQVNIFVRRENLPRVCDSGQQRGSKDAARGH